MDSIDTHEDSSDGNVEQGGLEHGLPEHAQSGTQDGVHAAGDPYANAENAPLGEGLRLQGGPTPTEDEPPETTIKPKTTASVAAAESLLIEQARRAGPGSFEFQYLYSTLIDFALGVLSRMGPRRILRELLERGLQVSTPAPHNFPEALPTLRYEAAYAVAHTFMAEHVMDGGWQRADSTSLAIYLTEKVFDRFANIYRRYYREETFRELWYSPSRPPNRKMS